MASSAVGSEGFAFFALGSVRVELSTALWDTSESFLFLTADILSEGMILLLRLGRKGVFSLLLDAPLAESARFWREVE